MMICAHCGHRKKDGIQQKKAGLEKWKNGKCAQSQVEKLIEH